MLSPAILAAVPLLGGVVIGAFGGVHVRIALALLATAWAGAAGGLRVGRRRSFVAACVVGYAAAGITLGASAVRGASRSSILEWFTASPGAREPVRLTAVLRQDASVTPFGVVAVADTTSIVTEDRALPIDGGVRVSVGGALASSAARTWRQGRTITFSALLRDPVSYRNVGVPDDRDRFTREGLALLASVKSAALVTVVTHGAWYDEASASVRAYVRAATTDAVGRWNAKSAGVVTAILIGDRRRPRCRTMSGGCRRRAPTTSSPSPAATSRC